MVALFKPEFPNFNSVEPEGNLSLSWSVDGRQPHSVECDEQHRCDRRVFMSQQQFSSSHFECRLHDVTPQRDLPVHMRFWEGSRVALIAVGINEISLDMLAVVEVLQQESSSEWTVNCSTVNPFLHTTLPLVRQPMLHIYITGMEESI